MDSFIFTKSANAQGLIEVLEFSGVLTVENSENIKDELLAATRNLNNKVNIEIKDVQEIDISFIQIILAFINYMDDHHISSKFEWALDADIQELIEGVGFGNELFLN
jgi:anti-anti-sigma regulatory factor